MKTNELRKKYLDFFVNKGHQIIPSASLIPENDPTTLFTGSGMQPMVPFLLGEKHPAGNRISDSQKCFRAQDMNDVGDNRHTTFFEMLGNWSLGDYFKKEQISWMFEFLLSELKLDPQQLFVTCFRGDDEQAIARDTEAAEIWKSLFAEKGIRALIADHAETVGMQDSRIFYYSASKNWWSRSGVPEQMPVGEPGGPDSEMFWDFGENLNIHENSEYKHEVCHVNCDCGRFMEIGNNVFMEYVKTDSGFNKLSQRNVDFGGGLERMAAAVRNDRDIFHIDVFDHARSVIERLSGIHYGDTIEETYAFRVILDHLRATTFLISDEAIPSNKDQGYFTRRLIRRAVRYAHTLGITQNFCAEVASGFLETYAEHYPELRVHQERIYSELNKEEEKFRLTLENGLKEIDTLERIGNVDAKHVFDLYQTYGFPYEMIKEELARRGLVIDEEELKNIEAGFTQAFKKHQEISRQGSEQKFKGGLADHSDMSLKYHTATHLLHAALRHVLGPEAVQKGSNITPERLRFDFVYPQKLTEVQKQEVVDLVNAAIKRDYPVSFEVMTYDQAQKKGAIGLFTDLYGEQVKVYSVGDPDAKPESSSSAETFSREVCGGPHVTHTGELGVLKIVKEEAIASGIRRIKAILE